MSEAIRVAFGEMFGIELVQNAAVCYNPLEAKTIRRMAEGYEVDMTNLQFVQWDV